MQFTNVCFNRCSQLSKESVDQFITEVHSLADSCKFEIMKEELICDRLVVGIQDLALSEQLQLEPHLTLDKAKQLIQQQEAVKLQQDFLQKPLIKEKTSLDAVRQPTPRRKLPTIPPTQRPLNSPSRNCQRCGREHILNTPVQQKMLCVLNVTGGAITVYSVSLPQLE